MATSGYAYAISVAIYFAVTVAIFCCFSIWRNLTATKKFFAPKRYVQAEGFKSPPKLGTSFLGWVPQIVRMNEAEVIATAGIDAALYLSFLKMAWEVFVVVSLLTMAVILPINITGDEVDVLLGAQAAPAPANPFTYWVPPPPPPSPGPAQVEPADNTIEMPEVPEFYNDTDLAPAPPGLEWHKYANDVPPLPPAPAGYVWNYASQPAVATYYFTDIDKTTLSNIPQRSLRMVAHALIMWVITAFVLFQLWRYCQEALRLRIYYLLNSPKGAESHTVLCTNIPAVSYGTIPNRLDGTLLKLVPQSVKDKANKQVADLGTTTSTLTTTKSSGSAAEEAANAAAAAISTAATKVDATTGRWEMPDRWSEAVDGVKVEGSVQGMVEHEFTEIYKEDFAAAHMIYDTSSLDPLVKEYNALQMKATDLVDDYVARQRRGAELKPKKVTVIGAKLGEWGKGKYGMTPTKVDALDFYNDRMTYLADEIAKAQVEAKSKVYPSAFVTFNRRTAQVVASNALMSEDLSTWTCQAAPRPEEIVWSNLAMRSWERAARGILMWVAFFLVCAFFMIPVTAVQSLLATNSLVGFVQDIPIASSVITAILPGLALIIFMAMLPPLIKVMNKFAGMVSLSEIDLGLMSRFFIFQVITVFFGSFIAGSVANQFEQLVNNPTSIITLLGAAAPQTSIFFLTYVTLRALFVVPFSILRIVPLVIFFIKSKLASTERAKARIWQNQMFSYGTEVPTETMVFLMGLTFCVICPIIAPVTLIFFTTTYVVRKYNLGYVYRQPYQAGGMAWPRILNQCIFGLFIAQIILLCLLALKKSVAGPIILIPLPFITFGFLRTVQSTFWRPMAVLSLMSAAEIDEVEAAGAGGAAAVAAQADKEVQDFYLSPSFVTDEAAHAETLQDCSRVKAVLAGGEDEALFAREAEVFSEEGEEVAAAVTTANKDAAMV